MLRTSSKPSRSRKDRLSLSIVPEQSLETELRFSNLRMFFDESTSPECSSRLIFDNQYDNGDRDNEATHVEAIIMREVSDWLELRKEDDRATWMRERRKMLCTTDNILTRLKCINPAPEYVYTPEHFGLFAHLLALQLLASCYTLQPPSSADNWPLFQQSTQPKLVTALRLHAFHRFSPAAGHHARDSSESAPWPGLFTGLSLEDRIAEDLSRQRRLQKHGVIPSQLSSTPQQAAENVSAWSDGPAPQESDGRRCKDGSSDSGSSVNSGLGKGFWAKLICSPSTPKSWRLTKRSSDRCESPCKAKFSTDQHEHYRPAILATSDAVPRAPLHAEQMTYPAMYLGCSRSDPWRYSFADDPQDPGAVFSRTSSISTIGSPPDYPFTIPKIRRISATTAGGGSLHSSILPYGKADLPTPQEHLEEIRISPDWREPSSSVAYRHALNGVSPRRSHSASMLSPRASRQSDHCGKEIFPVQHKFWEGGREERIENTACEEGKEYDSDDSVNAFSKRKAIFMGTPLLYPNCTRAE